LNPKGKNTEGISACKCHIVWGN